MTFAGSPAAGAVYTPADEIVPLLALPLTLQVTAVFVVPVTVAVKVNVFTTVTVLCGALTVTVMTVAGGVVLPPPNHCQSK